MVKSIGFSPSNFHRERRRAIIMIFTILSLALFMTQFVSAEWQWDNVKRVNSETGEITIKNSLGLGKDIAVMKLNTPQIYNVIRGKDRLVAEFTIDNRKEYQGWFNNMRFYDRRRGGEEISREFVYKYKSISYQEVPKYKVECSNPKSCVRVQDGTKSEEVVTWIPIDRKAKLPKGEITIGVFTDVYAGDHVEWIPTLYGVKIPEWAAWVDSFEVGLLHWWEANSTYSNMLDLVSSAEATNGTLEGGAVISSSPEGPFGKEYVTFDGVDSYVGVTEPGNIPCGIENFTIIIMFQSSSSSSIWSKGPGVADAEWEILGPSGANAYMADAVVVTPAAPPAAPAWNEILWTRNTTGQTIFLNGVKSQGPVSGASSTTCDAGGMRFGDSVYAPPSRFLIGNITKYAIYNRSFTDAEAVLMNDTYYNLLGDSIITVTLDAPINNTDTALQSYHFSSNYTQVGINFLNSTLYLWYNNGTLFGINTSVVDTSKNSSNLSLSNLPLGDGNMWNYQVCGTNSTADIVCYEATSNRTINFKIFSENTNTYNNETISGNSERFELNITLREGSAISFATLYYNATAYDGVFSFNGGNDYSLYRTITIPIIDAEANYTFYWELTVSGEKQNSSFNNQTINILGIDGCSSNTVLLLNYTFKDEETQEIVNATNINSSIEIDVQIYSGDGSQRLVNFSNNYTRLNTALVCLETNLTETTNLKMYAQAKYFADEYATENYYIQNFTLTNETIPQHIDLFDIKTADATEFLITYKDSSFLAVEDALIQIQRKYVSEGVFKSVEIEKTDEYGQTRGYFDTEGVTYTIIVTKEGAVLSVFDNIAIFCEDKVIGKCNINLYASTSITDPTDFYDKDNLNYGFFFNRTTRTISVLFSSTDGSSSTMLLNVTKMDAYNNLTICSSSITTSAGTLTCVVSTSYSNISVIAVFYKGTIWIDSEIYTLSSKAREIFGDNLVIYVMVLILSLVLMFTPSLIGVIMGLILGVIGSVLIFNVGGTIIGTTSLIVWVVILGIILIWKIQQRGIE